MNREIDFDIAAIQHVIERTPNPDWRMERALNQNLYIIGAAMDGSAEYTIDDRIYLIKKGDLILLRPGMVRAARSFTDDPWHFISIGCQLQFPSPETFVAFNKLPIHFQEVPKEFLRKCEELVHIWNGHSRYNMLMVKGLIFGLYYDLFRHWEIQHFQPSQYRRIIQVQEYIQQNYFRQLSPKELAELCGYSESYFRQLFQKITGMSCSQYIVSVKIGVAKNLLLSGTANVSEAADLTGFSDVYYFSKLFKRITGFPPSHFKM